MGNLAGFGSGEKIKEIMTVQFFIKKLDQKIGNNYGSEIFCDGRILVCFISHRIRRVCALGCGYDEMRFSFTGSGELGYQGTDFYRLLDFNDFNFGNWSAFCQVG